MAREHRFDLGDEVRFTHTVRKKRGGGTTTFVADETLPYRNIDFMTPERKWTSRREYFDRGIIVGRRIVHDYDVDKGGWDESPSAVIIRGTGRTAWLIAYDLHRNPALVFDEHVEAVEKAALF